MADVVSKAVRSRMMSGIRSKNTKPELVIRSGLHRRGFRFKLHDRSLPGSPDLVFPKYHAVIFIHGCFWHGHDCHLFKWPKTRPDFWKKKIGRNREVDQVALKKLRAEGWRMLTIWECALKGKTRRDPEMVVDEAAKWLMFGGRQRTIRGRAQWGNSGPH